MGYYGEDADIPFSFLIPMWVGEGFVRPIYGKSLEEAAKEYVIELIDRNLLLFKEVRSEHNWMLQLCKIHDLLRDLCLRECETQNFIKVVGDRSLNLSNNIRRIYIPTDTPKEEAIPILESASLLRSLWWESIEDLSISSRLLRVVGTTREIYDRDDIFLQFNLRVILLYIALNQYRIPSSISRIWNLHTLIIFGRSQNPVIDVKIWNMPQLRTIVVVEGLCLPDPPSGEGDMSDGCIVLENLHTLAVLHSFKFSEEVVKRIPHVKTLETTYVEVEGSSLADYGLNNLGRLQLLEHLVIKVKMQSQIVQNLLITFPRSLKEIELFGTSLHWDDVATKIGSLPLLQHLKLDQDSCVGAKWETVDGQFCSLEFLRIRRCGNLEYWITEAFHFPRLEHLYLKGLHKLYEIPLSIGDIATLQSIEVKDCSDSACSSAETIKREQEELGNEDLEVQIRRMKIYS